MKNLSSLLLTALCCQLLSACTDPGQLHGHDGNPPAVGGQLEETGTGDGGGGNALNYKMLESHLINPNDLEVVKTRVAPILAKLFPPSENNSKMDMFAIKNWYLAPIKLKTIPKDVLGIDFTSDRLQQVAIQSERAVWIDSNYFEKMDDNEKARLIVHEVLMSVYLMRFESMGKLCSMSARTGSEGCETITPEQLEQLELQYKPETKRRLADADYEAIRAATAWVFANEKQLSEASFKAYADRISFSDKRFGNAADEDESSKSSETSLSKIVLALKKAKLSGKLQKSCLALHSKTTFNCELSWNLTEKPHPAYPQLTLSTLELTIKDSATQQIVQQSATDTLPAQNVSLGYYAGYYNYAMFPKELFSTNESGKKFTMTHLSFEKDEHGSLTLAGIIMIPVVYVDTEKYEDVRTENGKEMRSSCERRSFSRIHPQDPASDTIILMSHGGVMEKVAFMDMIKMNDINSCQGLSVESSQNR